MAKDKPVAFDTQDNSTLGEINITTGVLENIAAKAASEIPGVLSTVPKLEAGKFLRIERTGVVAKMNQENGRISIDVSVRIRYGYSVPEVAFSIQDRVKEQILFMTDLVVDEVNVHILAIETDSYSDQEFLQLEEEYGEDSKIETGV